MRRIENSIVLLRDFDTVFELTNSIELWPRLFSEYEKAEVLERTGNEVLFRLTTFAEGDRPARTWTSRRLIDKPNKQATAERLEPTFPFKYMHICWTYEELPQSAGTSMTWVQEFEVHHQCPWTDEQMESFLNHNTRVQMQEVKQKIEKGLI